VGVLGPIFEVIHYWLWEGVRRMVEKFLFKRDG